jgi:hypothetical protein
VVHIIWQKIATMCKIVCNGCWIISDIAAVPKRMMHAYRQKDSWLSEMQVFDFTSMYDKFVHHDMKLRLRELLRDERETGGSDGVYPTYMTDTNGNVT